MSLIRNRLLKYYIPNPTEPYLTFSSDKSFTLKTYNLLKNWNGTLEYSTDKTTWSVWSGTTTLSSVNNELYLRGTGNTYISISPNSDANANWVLTGTNISCSGNIENLLDYSTVLAGNHPTMSNNCYNYMFFNRTNLVEAPELPATTLADNCYYRMFYGCTSLNRAPSLPASTLADSCYYGMFYGCTNLRSASSLPATTLADNCYRQMFRDCKSLTTLPELPATTLADSCYYQMFYGCTHPYLTQAPELPATTLASSCYNGMFSGCTNLTQAPELPATTLATSCYRDMFRDAGIEQLPQLPATTLTDSCYYQMFMNCKNIKVSSTETDTYIYEWRIPTIGTGTTATGWATNLITGTSGTRTGNPVINTTYYVENPPV